jgi:hypothetical protein
MRSLLASSSSVTEGLVPLTSSLQRWLGVSFGIPDLSLASFDKWGQSDKGPALISCLPAGVFGPHGQEDAFSMAVDLLTTLSRNRVSPIFLLLPGTTARLTYERLRGLKVKVTILLVVLAAGTVFVHQTYLSMVQQDLAYRKKFALARFSGSALPGGKPPFKVWATSKVFFPPSAALLNKAIVVLQTGLPQRPGLPEVIEYPSAKGIPKSEATSLHLAISYTAARVGEAALASLRPETVPAVPPHSRLCVPATCQMCKKRSVPALVRCPSCSLPRYCSRRCRAKMWPTS